MSQSDWRHIEEKSEKINPVLFDFKSLKACVNTAVLEHRLAMPSL